MWRIEEGRRLRALRGSLKEARFQSSLKNGNGFARRFKEKPSGGFSHLRNQTFTGENRGRASASRVTRLPEGSPFSVILKKW
ncbi:hypothetical protein M3202_00765 [Alkalihalobacillus oceani]|uniref:Uncharacterized protein n=1 Tax=Halalkalibacter oceani TaxID=1653776 RepID=A0A9X2DM29_9BACI|nr:hypothetical protein [Halalkalibacter oceani]MCM3712600.1 hypothetical protein [Halalkalibacter oceani]